ncbi:hypothetical protein [Allomesorhizobium camelthorni]|uniref:Uncharacterized protein n=1 Tax=Allomesorhizobium camelthorni TaxID=475069 RepID=A0A6G4WJ11_9HYPH|nr:hypothetical protein [Mesorhizobium camelthorni]NGO54785.1 hypothetical protein [Mesorhizobium camelthorni]
MSVVDSTSTLFDFNLTGVPRSDRTTIDHASLFGGLRSSAFELSALPVSDVFRGVLLLSGIGAQALPSMGLEE